MSYLTADPIFAIMKIGCIYVDIVSQSEFSA